MKIKIKKTTLLKFIDNNYKVVDHNSAIYEYKCFFFKVLDDTLYLTSLYDEMSMVNKLSQDFETDGSGEFLINARILMNIISKCYEDIVLNIDKNKMSISSENSYYEITLADIDEFNYVDFTLPNKSFTLASETLIRVIRNVAFAAAQQNLDTSYVLDSFNISYKDKKIFFTATDSSRLAQEIIDLDYDEEFSLVLPIKATRILKNFKLSKNIKVYPGLHFVKIVSANSIIKINLIETSFENFLNKKLFEYDWDTKLHIKKQLFLDLINKVSLRVFGDDIKKIRLNINTNSKTHKSALELYSYWEQIGSSFVKNFDFVKEGKDISFSVNSSYLLESLKVFDEDLLIKIKKMPGRILVTDKNYKGTNHQLIALLKD